MINADREVRLLTLGEARASGGPAFFKPAGAKCFPVGVYPTGAGIAGLTLAFWLERLGHHPTIIEQSPHLRDEGYGIDFFGPGYDIAEKMGIRVDLERIHYALAGITFVDGAGRPRPSSAGSSGWEAV